MCDTISCCKRCGNPTCGLVYELYKEKIKEIIKTSHRNPNDLLTSAEVDLKGDPVRKLLDDLMIFRDCCRITIMTFATY